MPSAVRIYLQNENIGKAFERSTARAGDMVRKAARGAANHAAIEIELRGREDIAGAGNFGSRWTDGLKATVTEGGGNIRITVTMDVPYWKVFEYGATIHPKNGDYLWLPFSFATDAQGVPPSAFGKPLFYTERVSDGLPLLIASDDKQPKYFGKEEVVEPKKFHLGQIIAEVAKELRVYYSEMMKAP